MNKETGVKELKNNTNAQQLQIYSQDYWYAIATFKKINDDRYEQNSVIIWTIPKVASMSIWDSCISSDIPCFKTHQGSMIIKKKPLILNKKIDNKIDNKFIVIDGIRDSMSLAISWMFQNITTPENIVPGIYPFCKHVDELEKMYKTDKQTLMTNLMNYF